MYLYMVAPCLFGLEGLVADDLKFLGAQNVSSENGRVFLKAMTIYLPAQISAAALRREF